ncbi:hypothetical protein L6452_23828 [Arctium lappa]|uniref:Uncharacterized protein n=1 Tax=Arctium lappa TaxID=4217 RepID=A0ACB9A7R8_ARCLA|nr:hypothetical protein L6452_23828 [Arctium lappa]
MITSTDHHYVFQDTDLEIYKALLRNDWNSANKIFEEHPELRTKPINRRLETPLMIAVGTNCSHRFVRMLVSSLRDDNLIWDALHARNCEGDTALHYAAKVGNLWDATLLMSHSSGAEIALLTNDAGETPLLYAAWLGRKKEMLEYLFYKTGVYDSPTSGIPNESLIRGDLLTPAIDAGFVVLPVPKSKITGMTNQLDAQNEESIDVELPDDRCTSKEWFKNILLYLEKRNQDVAWTILGSTIAEAVNCGNYEVIEECIIAYPSTIWATFPGFYLFHSAIHQRQERVYNLVYQMTNYKAFVASYVDPDTNENALHIAAKLAPSHRLNTTTGAALQMQRELQWFNEIKNNFIEPAYIEEVNVKGKTPRMVFTEEHENLLKEGQKWMKGTASSSTVVAALIVTVAFAAAFTVPGGNKSDGKDEGKPVYLDKGSFMLFIISDAIALFSSVTSVLMFLGILTSRYAEGDFLYALPKKMMIGLLSLFLSLAATMVAFGATLSLVLQDKVTWIAVPLVIITSIPVALYAGLQFPLLIELFYNTYGPSIFHRQHRRMIH